MSLSHRIWLASGLLALLVGGAFAALIAAASAQRDATEREDRSKDVIAASLQLERLVLDVETAVSGLTITRSNTYLQPYRRAMAQIPNRLQTLQGLVAEDAGQSTRVEELGKRVRAYQEFVVALIPIVQETPEIAAEGLLVEEGRRYTTDIRLRFEDIRGVEDTATAAAAADAERTAFVAVVVGAFGVTASILLIALFGIILARSISRPVRAVADGAQRLAGGDLALRLPESGPGEVGDLTRSFNAMAARLEEGRRELETQNEQLRESEQTKTELISIVSHELRTPLASVLGFTALLLKRDFDPATRRHYLGIVDAQARRLAALLEDFLDVQRIEHEGLHLEHVRLDLGQLLREQVELYAAQSPKHRLEVRLSDEPLSVHGDANRLAQVVGNLLSNAIKYSPDGGSVEIAATREGDGVRVQVRDEGLGIPHELQSQIFTKFYRGDAAATGIAGTGLGLAVSRQIVEAHGGRIGFESEPGRGSTFWVELPAASADVHMLERKEATG